MEMVYGFKEWKIHVYDNLVLDTLKAVIKTKLKHLPVEPTSLVGQS